MGCGDDYSGWISARRRTRVRAPVAFADITMGRPFRGIVTADDHGLVTRTTVAGLPGADAYRLGGQRDLQSVNAAPIAAIHLAPRSVHLSLCVCSTVRNNSVFPRDKGLARIPVG